MVHSDHPTLQYCEVTSLQLNKIIGGKNKQTWFTGEENGNPLQYSGLEKPISSVQFSHQYCPTLCEPIDCSTPGLPVHNQLQSLLKFLSIELVMPLNHLILCCPLPLLPSIFPSIRVFSKESVLPIRWPKYWSFSFSISPFNAY